MDKEQLEKKIEVDFEGQKYWTNWSIIKAEWDLRRNMGYNKVFNSSTNDSTQITQEERKEFQEFLNKLYKKILTN